MKYEYIPVPKKNKMKKISISLFLSGLIVFIIGGIEAIPFRVGLQLGSAILLVASIAVVVKYALKAYRYRIDDCGDGDEFFIDEITRSACFTVCRLELSKLVAVKKWSECDKELRSKKRYSYCPDILGDDTYLLEFFESKYDNSDKIIRIRLTPDEKLVSILTDVAAKNAEKQSDM